MLRSSIGGDFSQMVDNDGMDEGNEIISLSFIFELIESLVHFKFIKLVVFTYLGITVVFNIIYEQQDRSNFINNFLNVKAKAVIYVLHNFKE